MMYSCVYDDDIFLSVLTFQFRTCELLKTVESFLISFSLHVNILGRPIIHFLFILIVYILNTSVLWILL